MKHIHLNSKIKSARFDQARGIWYLVILSEDRGKFEEEADVFINAAGILNKWKWPDIPGLHSFQGSKLHTAQWVKRHQKFGLA